MADVELTLGAKNEASATLRQFSQQVTQTAQSVEFSMRGLAQLAGLSAAIIGLVEGARALASFTSNSIASFDDLNRSAIKLSETVAYLPTGTKQASDEMQKVATNLERITNVDAARIMEQMASALRRGASVDAIEDMAEAALGLSRVFDRDLASAMRMVEDATKGNFEAFEGLIPGINELATVEQKLAAVSELATKGLLNKADSARGAIEASDALRIAVKNLYEAFGELLAPVRDLIYRGFALAFEFIRTQMMPAMTDLGAIGQQMADTLAQAGMRIAEAFVTGFTAAETAVMRFSDILEIVKTSVVLQVERISNDVMFVFNELLKFGSWFADSWSKLMYSAVFEGPKYTFSDVLRDMPTVGERAVTETELALQAILDDAVGNLTEGFDDKIRERLEALRNAFNLDIAIDLKPRAGAQNALQDQLRSLTAFESRVLVRGQTDSPIQKLVENTNKQVEEQKRTNTLLEGVDLSPGDKLKIEVVR